jgi:threonine dehydratase
LALATFMPSRVRSRIRSDSIMWTVLVRQAGMRGRMKHIADGGAVAVRGQSAPDSAERTLRGMSGGWPLGVQFGTASGTVPAYAAGMLQTRLDLDRVQAARRVIHPAFLDTPHYRCEPLETHLGCEIAIKLETANPVRSFKGRGTEVIASQLADHGERAVVCASAGNLGQALAWSGRERGLGVTVVASFRAPVAKLDRIRALGATLELVDGDFDMARERAAEVSWRRGVRLVEDSLDIETCEGAATIGLELVKTFKPSDVVLIALGGGALASGVGYVAKVLAPSTEVVCVQPVGADAMTRSWHAGRVITTDSTDTIADGVAVRRPIPTVLDDLVAIADDAITVQESSIIAGMRALHDHAALLVEPSAALGVAAILENPDRFAGRRVVTIVCGSNVDPDSYRHWIAGEESPPLNAG